MTGTPAVPTPYLRWPPPGLERLQGDAWRIVGEFLLGGGILVFPLLRAVGEARSFANAGPFGENWWIVLLTSLVGLALLVSGGVKLFRLLLRASRAADEGYGWRTVLLVAVDGKRENGFLLQGGRVFSVLSPEMRHRLALVRLLIAGLWFLGALWHPVGFVAGLLLATRGLIDESGLVWMTAAPSFLLLGLGYLLSAWQHGVLRGARREWFRQPWSRDLEREEIRQWKEELARRDEEGARWDAAPSPRAGGRLRLASWGVVAGALAVAIPSLALVVAASVSPVLALISTPSFGEMIVRVASVEPLRDLRLPADPAITPQAAGEAFHVMSTTSRTIPADGERPPVRTFAEPLDVQEAERSFGQAVSRWSGILYTGWDTLSPERRDLARRVAEHPILDEWAVVGRAATADLVGGRWTTPFPASMGSTSVPIPRVGNVRNLAYAAGVRAAIEFRSGRPAEAERVLREVIGGGLLLVDDGVTPIENLVGTVIVAQAGYDLAALYRATGRAAEADELEAAIVAAERAARMGRSGWPSDPHDMVRAMPSLVLDRYAIRGLRWDAFAALSGLAPCMNANRIVFGPDEAYLEWLGRTRQALVRFPSEEAFYEVMSRGWFGEAGEDADLPLLGRLFTVTMGGEGPGSCARIFHAMSAAGSPL